MIPSQICMQQIFVLFLLYKWVSLVTNLYGRHGTGTCPVRFTTLAEADSDHIVIRAVVGIHSCGALMHVMKHVHVRSCKRIMQHKILTSFIVQAHIIVSQMAWISIGEIWKFHVEKITKRTHQLHPFRQGGPSKSESVPWSFRLSFALAESSRKLSLLQMNLDALLSQTRCSFFRSCLCKCGCVFVSVFVQISKETGH